MAAADDGTQGSPPIPTVIDVQPDTKEAPKTELIPLSAVLQLASAENVPLALNAPLPRTRPPVWRLRLWRCWRIFVIILSGLGRVFFIVCCGIGIAVLFCIVLGVSFGFAAANGAILMLIGNGILRAAHQTGYTGNSQAAAAGAVGALLATMCTGVIFECVPKTDINYESGERQHSWWVRAIATVVVGTLTGTIGCAILRKHVDLKGLDILHATRAGAVGGAIMGPGSIFLFPVIIAALGILLSPLWIAMAMGFEFVSSSANESWGESSHRYSVCLCYGSCGDPEIEAEVQRVRDVEDRHQAFKNQGRMDMNHF